MMKFALSLSASFQEADQVEEPIVARAINGDPLAIAHLVREELPRVERLLLRILGPRDDLEDLVQNVFLETCKALPRFRNQSAISTFIGGITIHVARRAMRRSRLWPFSLSFFDASLSPLETESSEASPERIADVNESLRRVRSILERMSSAKRIAFALWAFEGMEISDIARITNASIAATRSRIFYAQKEIKSRAQRDPYLRELLEEVDYGTR